MINEIILEFSFFSAENLDIWEKERYCLTNEGSLTHEIYADGNMDVAKHSTTVTIGSEATEEIIRKADELAWVNERVERFIDDCSGEVKICYNDLKTVTQPRGSRVYDYLIDQFEKYFYLNS